MTTILPDGRRPTQPVMEAIGALIRGFSNVVTETLENASDTDLDQLIDMFSGSPFLSWDQVCYHIAAQHMMFQEFVTRFEEGIVFGKLNEENMPESFKNAPVDDPEWKMGLLSHTFPVSFQTLIVFLTAYCLDHQDYANAVLRADGDAQG